MAEPTGLSGSDDVALAVAQLRESGLPANLTQMIELASRVGALAGLLAPEERERYLHTSAVNMRANLGQVIGQVVAHEEEAAKPKLVLPGMVVPRG